MTKLASRLLGLVSLFALCAIVTGCNTVEGMGEDISAAGDGISHASSDTEDAMHDDDKDDD